MQEGLAAHGRKLVTIVDPHIKKDPNYYIYKEAQDKGLYVLNKDKQEFDGYGSAALPARLSSSMYHTCTQWNADLCMMGLPCGPKCVDEATQGGHKKYIMTTVMRPV